MSSVENSLRPFWAVGLNEISGRVAKGMGGWLSDGEYQVYAPILSDSFELNIGNAVQLLSALAADINRFATAAFESVHDIAESRELPRSTAWLVIKSYYAAFFAAHAILRMLGGGVVRIDSNEARAVTKIADIYGAANGKAVAKGSYEFVYRADRTAVLFEKKDSLVGGSHEIFWTVFNRRIKELSNRVLKSTAGSTRDNQIVSVKLGELCDNLCHASSYTGAWLEKWRDRHFWSNHQEVIM